MLKSVVDIWILKPNVIHKKIFGARILKSSNNTVVRIIYPNLRSKIDNFEEIVTIGDEVIHFTSIHVDYSISLNGKSFEINIENLKITNLFTFSWFSNCLQVKLCQWGGAKLNCSPPSLGCVNLDDYQKIYAKLKLLYAKNLISSWCERTDPQKFVHEDIGIASYLMCLWKNCEGVYFVDIGCGNGLLVFLLVSEGFKGIGIDIRKRKIWNQYPETIKQCLVENTVDPSTHPGFPEANWLIGNHSDELTPWLPVLAVRSNENCRVFTIPCCSYSLFQNFNLGDYLRHRKLDTFAKITANSCPDKDSNCDAIEEIVKTDDEDLNEKKENRGKQEKTFNDENMWHGHYRFYVRYLTDVFKICGFEPEIDIMRIPSTKRLCLIGKSLNREMDISNRFGNIKKLISMESSSRPIVNPNASHFVPRDKYPITKQPDLKREELEDLQMMIFKMVLEAPKEIKHPCFDPRLIVSKSGALKTTDRRWWNPGGCVKVIDAIGMLDENVLAKMKMVRGGLQAILRSHRAFIVTGHGIALRFDASLLMHQEPLNVEESVTSVTKAPTTKKKKRGDVDLLKTKACWMETHHPDGCPYPCTTCNFKHTFE